VRARVGEGANDVTRRVELEPDGDLPPLDEGGYLDRLFVKLAPLELAVCPHRVRKALMCTATA
jgi:hypothetical protein